MADDMKVDKTALGPAVTNHDDETPPLVGIEPVLKTELVQNDDKDNEQEANAIILDPINSERQIYTDPFTKLQREIWRPGDGDGDRLTDFHDRPGRPVPFNQRWRFYQSPTGAGPIKRGVNEPPKFVILDDQAAHEVYVSDIFRAQLVKFWPHDFGGVGTIRNRRPHRGRGAVGDADATGIDKYHFVKLGQKDEKYYFTGQADYKPILYRSFKVEGEATLSEPTATKSASPVGHAPDLEPKKRGHNQHTPLDELVKKTKRFRPPRSNIFSRKRSVNKASHRPVPQDAEADQSMWLSTDETGPRKKQKRLSEGQTAIEPNSLNQETRPVESPNFAGAASGVASVRIRQEREHQDHFSRLLTEQESSGTGEGPPFGSSMTSMTDSGSYATNLEMELAVARKAIEEQEAILTELQAAKKVSDEKVQELTAEVALLKGQRG